MLAVCTDPGEASRRLLKIEAGSSKERRNATRCGKLCVVSFTKNPKSTFFLDEKCKQTRYFCMAIERMLNKSVFSKMKHIAIAC